MSGVIKAIGKTFKKVAKVVKKFALPILAIAAVGLTGGAALGLLPAIGGAGGLGAAIGLSPALTGIISSAATSATIGAVGSAVTGGNIVKGATAGLVAGGAVGAAGALLGPASAAARTASVASGAAGAGAPVPAVTAGGIGSGISGATSAIPAVSAAASPAAGIGSGIMGFVERNPMLAGQVINGIGSGLLASEQAKEQRKADARDQANYSGYNGLNLGNSPVLGASTVPGSASPSGGGFITYDAATGRFITRKG